MTFYCPTGYGDVTGVRALLDATCPGGFGVGHQARIADLCGPEPAVEDGRSAFGMAPDPVSEAVDGALLAGGVIEVQGVLQHVEHRVLEEVPFPLAGRAAEAGDVPDHVADHLPPAALLGQVSEALCAARHEQLLVQVRDLADAGDAGIEGERRVVERQRRTGSAGIEDAPQPDADLLVGQALERHDRIGEQARQVLEVLGGRRPGILDGRVEHPDDPILERHLDPHRGDVNPRRRASWTEHGAETASASASEAGKESTSEWSILSPVPIRGPLYVSRYAVMRYRRLGTMSGQARQLRVDTFSSSRFG